MTVGILSFGATALGSGGIAALKIGAGGFVRGLDMNPDGTMFGFTDTYGDYWYNPAATNPGNAGGTGAWQQLTTPNSMPNGDPATGTVIAIQNSVPYGFGVYELRSAPSNSSIVYKVFSGYVYKSTNKGQTWTNLNASFAPLTFPQTQPNDSGLRTTSSGPKLAVDPINPSIVFFSPLSIQSYFTTNGGTTWTQITALPAPSSGNFTGFAYDRRVSTQSGGVSQTLYAFVYGTGCYVSTNAGSTWTKISGSGTTQTALTTVLQMYVDSAGNLWLTDNSGGHDNLWKWNGTAWTNFSWSGAGLNMQGGWSIAEDPTVASAQRIVVASSQCILIQTLDGGTTWHGGFSTGSANDGVGNVAATDIPYLAAVTDTPGVCGQIRFIPGTATIVMSTGIGVFKGTPPQTFTGSNWTGWTSISAGIEQLVANMVICPPGGVAIAASWDRAFIRSNGTQYPLTDQPAAFATAPGGIAIDWASSNPSTIVGYQAFGSIYISSDGGQTWPTTKSGPSGGGGRQCVAAASPTNFLLKPGGGNLQYTLDGGTTINDLGSYFNTNFSVALNSCTLNADEQTICADRVAANTFYATINGITVYTTSNGGAAWSVHSTIPSGLVGGNAMLRSVLGKQGHLIYCGGQTYQGSHPYTAASNCQIWTGSAWSDFGGGNARDIWCIGTGPQVGSYPRIVFWGWVNVAGTWTPGVWRTDDMGSTFHFLCSQNLYGTFDLPTWIEVDGSDPTTFYVGLTGSGYAKGKFS